MLSGSFLLLLISRSCVSVCQSVCRRAWFRGQHWCSAPPSHWMNEISRLTFVGRKIFFFRWDAADQQQPFNLFISSPKPSSVCLRHAHPTALAQRNRCCLQLIFLFDDQSSRIFSLSVCIAWKILGRRRKRLAMLTVPRIMVEIASCNYGRQVSPNNLPTMTTNRIKPV